MIRGDSYVAMVGFLDNSSTLAVEMEPIAVGSLRRVQLAVEDYIKENYDEESEITRDGKDGWTTIVIDDPEYDVPETIVIRPLPKSP